VYALYKSTFYLLTYLLLSADELVCMCVCMYKLVAVNASSDTSRGTGQVAGGSAWRCQDSVISDETMSGQ